MHHGLDRQLVLEARHPCRNVARRYWIRVSSDLFGAMIVEFGWGRIGTSGQTRRQSFSNELEMRRFVRTIIRRRKSAPRRIGAQYHLVAR